MSGNSWKWKSMEYLPKCDETEWQHGCKCDENYENEWKCDEIQYEWKYVMEINGNLWKRVGNEDEKKFSENKKRNVVETDGNAMKIGGNE